MATNSEIEHKASEQYWFNHLTPAEQLEFEQWAREVYESMPPADATTRTFYCDKCEWRGTLTDAILRPVEPCPVCGSAMGDVEVEETF